MIGGAIFVILYTFLGGFYGKYRFYAGNYHGTGLTVVMTFPLFMRAAGSLKLNEIPGFIFCRSGHTGNGE